MTDERKQEIISNLKKIVEDFEPTDDNPVLTKFTLISRYNSQYDNDELIGGQWVEENTDIKLQQ